MISRCWRLRSRLARRRWGRDERGTTAIEFAMVAVPFFLFAFGIMGIGLQFFTINALEHGVEQAARKIRTGQMQAGYTQNNATVDYTIADFKQLVCDEAGSYIDCGSKLVIHINSAAEWGLIATTPCLTNGALTGSAGNSTDAISTRTGGASQVVLVTACYEWDLGGMFWTGFWKLLVSGPGSANNTYNSDAADDKVVLQAVATFRTEPYN